MRAADLGPRPDTGLDRSRAMSLAVHIANATPDRKTRRGATWPIALALGGIIAVGLIVALAGHLTVR